MKPYPCLVFDANIVIFLFAHGLWEAVLSRCGLVLAETVVGEADFYVDATGRERRIDLSRDIEAGRITVISVTASEVAAFRTRFDPVYVKKLDDGETESLIFCLREGAPYRLCSADAIVFKVLALLDCAEQDISLEELLIDIGLSRQLPAHFRKSFRIEKRANGLADRLAGVGLKGK